MTKGGKGMEITSFAQLSLSSEVMRGIADVGFETPTPIQAQALGPLLDGRDVIGQAQTGTGKTAAFGIPLIERVDTKLKTVQGLVLAPTRELAVQIADHLTQLSAHTGVRVLAVYGGEPIQRQIRPLKQGIHIVVGTSGRILDHINQGTLTLKGVTSVVLDEADRMLDMGFVDDIRKILAETPRKRQTSLFSATIDANVARLSNELTHYPVRLMVSRDEIAVIQIEQQYVDVEPIDKLRVLTQILDTQHVERAIVFARTQRGAQRLARNLHDKGYDARPLHGGLTQPQRDAVTQRFRSGKLRILVATDVAARGLDISEISHIINHNVPQDPVNYFHRIGRTARMEAEGTSITLVSREEEKDMQQIRNMTKTRIDPLMLDYSPSAPQPTARCGKCGKSFIPNFPLPAGQPVYCPDCYRNHQRLGRQEARRRRAAKPMRIPS